MAEGRLQDKVILVTGASRGIGRAIAEGYAAEGARVAVAARDASGVLEVVRGIRAAGGRAVAITCDVTDHGRVRAMADQVVEAFGGLDVAVLNAGGSLHRSPVADSDPEAWVATLRLNTIGAYYCARAVIPHLKARGGGKIIAVGSGNGHTGQAGNSAYAVAKAGLWMLVRVLAQELAPDNISVNELVPGPVVTDLTRDRFGPDATVPLPATHGQEWIKQPADVVPLAVFLAAQPLLGPTAQSYSLLRRDL